MPGVDLRVAGVSVWADFKRLGALSEDSSEPGVVRYHFRLYATQHLDCDAVITVSVYARAGMAAADVRLMVPEIDLTTSDDMAYMGDIVLVASAAARRAKAVLDTALGYRQLLYC